MAVTINGSTGITTPGITNSGNETVSGNSAVTGNFSVGGNNISPVQSFRNKIINGNFDFWQRGTSVTGVASGQFVADRWFIGRSGSTANVSRQAFTIGQTDVPNEPTYFHRTIVTSSAGASNYCILIHRIESVRTLAGQTATFSFWAKADASKNIVFELEHVYGSGGSPSLPVSSIGLTTCALTASWKKFTITINIPSISGKTLGTDNNDWVQVNFWFDAGSDFNSRTNSLGQQSGTFDIAQVQLEAGSVATPFEMRPPGVEFALCQRYYQGNRSDGSTGEYGNLIIRSAPGITGNYYYWMPFSTIMRAIPTMSVGTPSYSSASSATFYNTTRHGSEIYAYITAGGYAVVPWTADAEL